MRISAIRIDHLPPFEKSLVEFPELSEKESGEVQIITGENGTGKTRLLCALAAILGNGKDLSSRIEGMNDVSFGGTVDLSVGRFFMWQKFTAMAVGVYGSDMPSDILSQYDGSDAPARNRAELRGSLVDVRNHISQRNSEYCSALAMRGTFKVKDSKVVAMENVPIGDLASNLNFESQDQSKLVCQTMTNLKMASAMDLLNDENRNADSRAIRIVNRLEAAVSTITGRPFSFSISSHPELNIQIRWGNEKMRFNLLPDGLRSIIGWLVACVARMSNDFPEHDDPLDIPVVVLIDEPETHLHPAWQQRIIPAAQQLLPNSQMFVVTHSPTVIASVNSGYIHVLKSNKEGHVSFSKPIPCSKGDTYIDAMEDVLGYTTWYDPETTKMLDDFKVKKQEFLAGEIEVKQLDELANEIGARSASLKDLMGREKAQLAKIMTGDH